MSIIPFTEKKFRKKQSGICSILGLRIGSTIPGSGSTNPNPDPHQNEADPKH